MDILTATGKSVETAVLAGLHDIASTDVAIYAVVAGFFSIIAFSTVNVLISMSGSPMGNEMKNSGHYRMGERNSVLCMYPVIIGPSIHALLLAFLRFAVVARKDAADWSIPQGITFSLIVWFTNAVHGIFMDYTTFKMSHHVALGFIAGSLSIAIVSGAALGYYF